MGKHGIMLTLFHHPPSLGLGLTLSIGFCWLNQFMDFSLLGPDPRYLRVGSVRTVMLFDMDLYPLS